MANIPIRDIPGAVVASPDPSNLIPMDNGSLMQKTTIGNAVNTALPMASQAEAEAGADNVKRMSPLRTKQAIDAQVPTIVGAAITALNLGTMSQEESSDYTPTAGLAAVALSNDYNDLDNLPTLGTMSQEAASDYTPTSGLAAVALSNDYGDLDNLPTLGTAAATDASDYATAAQGALADTAVQPGDSALVPSGGTIGQVLVKNSGTNYDTGWVSSAAATAVSYAPQTLTSSQQTQARTNISALGPEYTPTSTQVGNAMGGLAIREVGDFAFCGQLAANTGIAVGTIYAGSDLGLAAMRGNNTSANLLVSGSAISGSWRALGSGSAGGAGVQTATLFRRVA